MARNTTAYLTNNTSSRNDVNPFRSPKNSRVGSATRSVSQLSNRVSLQDFSTKMKARKIQLYRNGDPFFKGVTMAITQERFRTFNSLLSEVNKSALCDPSILQKGVRHIFSLHGEPIYDLDQLKDGHSYVCSSTPVFKRLKYESINSFNWYTSLRKVTPRNYEKLDVGERSQTPDCIPSQPKMVVVIRAGPRPRNMVRMLLNRRTATSFDQVLTHLAGALNMKTGTIRKMYMMTGPQVQDLSGFYTENKVFVAFESEKFSLDDLQMSEEEAKFVESACTNSRTTALEIVTPIIPIIRKPDYQSQSSHRVRSTASQPETRLLNFSTLAETCNVRPSSPALKPKVITVVNRGHSGENFGIPIPVLAKYRIGRVLAQGDFVLVKRCYEKSRVTRLALKIIDKSQLTQQEQSAVDCEVSLIRCISHPNILQLMDELDTPSELYLIMEFIKTNGPGQGGYLLDAVVGHEHHEVEASVLPIQLCRAVTYLHSLNIVHPNIRPDKIVKPEEAKTQTKNLDEHNTNLNNFNCDDGIPQSWPRNDIEFYELPLASHRRSKVEHLLSGDNVPHIDGVTNPLVLGKMRGKRLMLDTVFQIRNRNRLQRYNLRKNQLKKEVGKDRVNEKMLAHGSSYAKAVNICKFGFNRSWSGKNGTTYGRGCYFGYILGHIAKYATEDKHHVRTMILTRVLCGESAVGDSVDREPPFNVRTGRLFNSCMDDLDSPTVQIVYDDDATYAAYMALFTWQ